MPADAPLSGMRALSRREYTSYEGATLQAIRTGALQRIADATELMARRYSELVAEVERERGWRKRAEEREASERRSAQSLRGHVTRLKARVADLEQQLAERAGAEPAEAR